MSEDELKKYHHFIIKTSEGIELDLIETKYYEELLDLYKQKKEKIEAMNKGIDELVREKQDLKTELYMNSVSKDKIREFIEENTRTGRGYNEYEEGLIDENDRIIDKLSKMIEEN